MASERGFQPTTSHLFQAKLRLLLLIVALDTIIAQSSHPVKCNEGIQQSGNLGDKAAAYRQNSLESAATVSGCANLRIGRVGAWKRGRVDRFVSGTRPRLAQFAGLAGPIVNTPNAACQWGNGQLSGHRLRCTTGRRMASSATAFRESSDFVADAAILGQRTSQTLFCAPSKCCQGRFRYPFTNMMLKMITTDPNAWSHSMRSPNSNAPQNTPIGGSRNVTTDV